MDLLHGQVPIRRPGSRLLATMSDRVAELWAELKRTDSMERKIEITSEIAHIGRLQRGEANGSIP